MRLSRRLSGLYKPILLIASALAFAYLLLADADDSGSSSHSKKSHKHHKKEHGDNDDYEIGAREEFPGFEGTIMGRGLDEDVPKEVYRDSGKLGNYEPDQVRNGFHPVLFNDSRQRSKAWKRVSETTENKSAGDQTKKTPSKNPSKSSASTWLCPTRSRSTEFQRTFEIQSANTLTTRKSCQKFLSSLCFIMKDGVR